MRELDWTRVREGKDAERDRLAALPFDEKLRTVERLRERTREIKGPVSRVRVWHAPASNAHLSVPRSHQQVAYNAFARANAMLFGIAPAFASAITPSQVSTTAKMPPRPVGSR